MPDIGLTIKISNLVEYQARIIFDFVRENELQLSRFYQAFEHDVEKIVKVSRKFQVPSTIKNTRKYVLKQVSKEICQLIQEKECFLVVFEIIM